MESNSEELRIHCSEAAALLVMQQDPDIELAFRGWINIKGKGSMPTYWVERLRNEGEVTDSLDPDTTAETAAAADSQVLLPTPFLCVARSASSCTRMAADGPELDASRIPGGDDQQSDFERRVRADG
jgi:hypothetical protein